MLGEKCIVVGTWPNSFILSALKGSAVLLEITSFSYDGTASYMQILSFLKIFLICFHWNHNSKQKPVRRKSFLTALHVIFLLKMITSKLLLYQKKTVGDIFLLSCVADQNVFFCV